MAVVSLLCAGLGSCRTKPVSLTGIYGVAGKVVEPVLRVTETKGGYAFEERTVGEWQADPETPHVATVDEVRGALGVSGANFPVFGLATHTAMLLKVPPGWSNAGQLGAAGPGSVPHEVIAKTGYLLVNTGELFAAQKVELSGR